MISLHAGSALTAAFLASLVEAVEAMTIVLAVAIVRGWRPASLGATAGLVVLALIVVAVGPLLDRVPLNVLQIALAYCCCCLACGGCARRSCALRASFRSTTRRSPLPTKRKNCANRRCAMNSGLTGSRVSRPSKPCCWRVSKSFSL